MFNRHARQRAPYSTEVGQARGELYKKALDRANLAYASGFFLETIALVESLIADRLESIISLLDGQPARFGTVGEAARELKKRLAAIDGANGLLLLDAVTAWSRDRGRWIHEFAKVSAEGNLDWNQRLEDAQRVAERGLDLLREVTAEASAAIRISRSQSKPTSAGA